MATKAKIAEAYCSEAPPIGIWGKGNAQAGNQLSKGEVRVSNWRPHSTGSWKQLIRCKDRNIAQQAATVIQKLVNSKLIGYDQNDRNTLFKALKKNDWNVEKYIASGEKTETDCSAFVYASYCCVVPKLRESIESGISGRGNSPACQTSWKHYDKFGKDANGNALFELYTDITYINNPDNLIVGDLINEPAHHIAMVVTADGTGLLPAGVAPVSDYSSSSGESSGGSGTPGVSNVPINIPNVPNKVSKLASVSRQNDNILKQSDNRKSEFESLRNSMVANTPEMGREILMTSELYDSNILKGSQESKTERI